MVMVVSENEFVGDFTNEIEHPANDGGNHDLGNDTSDDVVRLEEKRENRPDEMAEPPFQRRPYDSHDMLSLVTTFIVCKNHNFVNQIVHFDTACQPSTTGSGGLFLENRGRAGGCFKPAL